LKLKLIIKHKHKGSKLIETIKIMLRREEISKDDPEDTFELQDVIGEGNF
jgi:hypothetical protein